MKVIEEYIKTEYRKMNWLDKLAMNYPKVKTTASLADIKGNLQFGNERKIRPSIVEKFITIVLIIFIGLLWLNLLKMLLQYRFPFLALLIFFSLLSFAIYRLLHNNFFNKRYIYTITIDQQGIRIDNNRHDWADIEETCIAVREGGRVTNSWLLLFKKDRSVIKMELLKFGISESKLSAVIEYYKAKAKENGSLLHRV